MRNPSIGFTLAAAAALMSGVDAISKITRAGRYLYDSDGTRFFIKGVAYQEQGAYSFLLSVITIN